MSLSIKMAIITEFPGAEVTVHVGGKVALEYDDPETSDRQQKQNKNVGTKVCCKYIECKDDAPFSIHLKVTDKYKWGHRNHSLNIANSLDGKWARSVFCREWNTILGDWKRDVTHRITKNDGGQFVEQGFKFTSITTVEEADKNQFKNDLRRLEQIGTIEVKFYRVIESGGEGEDFRPPNTTPIDLEVAETALKGKAISHGTGFSAPSQVRRAPRYVGSTSLPEDNGPIAIFRFLYRSQEALIQEGIIPRPPKKRDTKNATPAALVGLTEEEIQALAMERLQEKQATSSLKRKREKKEEDVKDIKDIKDIKDVKDVKDEKDVKHENNEVIDLTTPPRPYKKAKMAKGREVIDLDDDDE
ncbi:hypothetical protein F5Y06DRAFT_304721 [Hypoxylon sp. FL0890]|nr:hypothetical protein F5Y06DRAFT_304721 [Hypoxylon sp. FL0890]